MFTSECRCASSCWNIVSIVHRRRYSSATCFPVAADFEFRKYPVQKTFNFGAVNLLLGVNGVGKTCLLEAIEYLFCGKTRRMGSVLPRTVVSGSLAKSKLILRTKTTTSKEQLRARHLVWYGKSEVRTLTLHDSFSKFNFLDTDAAVRLSVDKSRDRIIKDLTQLLLGPEAAKALDRFGRVAGQLVEFKKKLETDIMIRDLRRSEAAARLQVLREAPRESDSLFSELLVGLRNAQWRQLPSDKSQTAQVSASVQSALANVAILRRTGAPIPLDVTELDAVLRDLAATEDIIDRLAKEAVARSLDDVRARHDLQQAAKQIEALEALAPIVRAGVSSRYHELQSLERQLGEQTAHLSEAEAAVGGLTFDDTLRRKMLSTAIAESTEAIGGAEKRVAAAKRALAAFELNQTHLSSLRQRLQSAARDILQRTGDERHCPLCQAEYSEADLDKRLEQLTHGLVAGESDRLRTDLQTAEALHQQRLSEGTALRALERYVDAEPTTTSLGAAISRVTQAREVVSALVSKLNAVRDAVRGHEEKGWTIERLVELASTAGIAGSEMSVGGVEAAQEALRNEQKGLLDTVNRLEGEAHGGVERAAEIGVAYGLSHPTVADVARVVSERRSAAEETRRAIMAIREHLNLATVSSISEVEAKLRDVRDLIVRLRTAVVKEQRDTEAIERDSKLVNDAVAEIEGLRVRLRRVDSADSVLEDLLSQQSERVLTETVLSENATKIASTFARIHAPNEFDLVVNGGLSIVRRSGGNVDLDEMSSGQRAAYALSLFLAMNERLTSGPRVLLLDDPVAHVDDINTLSLLDHLRDIALSGERQIFFATADSKIGALFGRKFRFLGDSFVQVELARE